MPNNKNRVQTYVNDATYERLKYLAESRETSVSSLVAEILQTVEQDADSPSSSSSQKSPYVTREEMIAFVSEAVARAEQHWESAASHEASVHRLFVEQMANQFKTLKGGK